MTWPDLHLSGFQAAVNRAHRAEAERDAAQAAAKDLEGWLDDALKALGVETVFDIPSTHREEGTDD